MIPKKIPPKTDLKIVETVGFPSLGQNGRELGSNVKKKKRIPLVKAITRKLANNGGRLLKSNRQSKNLKGQAEKIKDGGESVLIWEG